MATCLGKRCKFGLLCESFVNFFQMYVCVTFPFGFEDGMWNLIVLIPGHCLSIYFLLYYTTLIYENTAYSHKTGLATSCTEDKIFYFSSLKLLF